MILQRGILFVQAIFTLFMTVATQYSYILRNTSFYKALNCSEFRVTSLIQCVSLAAESKDVSFFFNTNDKVCKWQCVFLYSFENLEESWRRFELEWKRNSALFQPSMASSVYGGDPKKWGSSLATDGKIKGGVADTGFFSTSFENSPWIRVDLKDNLIIAFVRVFNRMYKLGERLHDVALEVSRGDGYEQRGYFRGPGVTNQVVDILCDPPSPGRYVRLKIINGENNILQIDEMEIYTLF